jgi:hypothetical protein
VVNTQTTAQHWSDITDLTAPTPIVPKAVFDNTVGSFRGFFFSKGPSERSLDTEEILVVDVHDNNYLISKKYGITVYLRIIKLLPDLHHAHLKLIKLLPDLHHADLRALCSGTRYPVFRRVPRSLYREDVEHVAQNQLFQGRVRPPTRC